VSPGPGGSKSSWHRSQHSGEVSAKNDEEHPAYGYRRIKVELEVRHAIRVNHKRLRRLLREWDLALKRQVARLRPSGVRRILKGGEREAQPGAGLGAGAI